MRALAYTGLVILFALIGLSFSRIDPAMANKSLELSGAGALIAAVAIAISAVFRDSTRRFERSIPSRKLVGLKIATVSFLIALVGWLVAVFVSAPAGYWVAASGVVFGGLGILVHLAIVLFARNDKAT